MRCVRGGSISCGGGGCCGPWCDLRVVVVGGGQDATDEGVNEKGTALKLNGDVDKDVSAR